MMRFTIPTLLAAALTAPAATPSPAAQRPTPEIARVQEIKTAPGQAAWLFIEDDPSRENPLGMVLACMPGNRVEARTYLGFFPADRRPLQLAVRRPDGSVERFGPVFTAGPEAGFNDTLLNDPATVRRFTRAVLRNGSLVSNGYNSFRNRLPDPRNRELLEALRACGL